MTTSPSRNPHGVRAVIPIERMRVKPLPPRYVDERERWARYIRRRPLPKRAFR